MLSSYFPLGLAKGEAFCNRVKERDQLKSNIALNYHTLVMSPRRYGKSSAVLYTLNEMNLPYGQVDLFVTINEERIERAIRQAVKSILSKVVPKHEQLMLVIKEAIQTLKLKFIVGSDGANIEIISKNENDVAGNIESTLKLLESILESKNTKAVLFIDEFQEISLVTQNKVIEGAIRSVAQNSNYLNFIFSGSNRHLLENMFNDKTRPLYKLCRRLNMERIHKEDYQQFIQHIAHKTFNKPINDDVLNEIFLLTELHPYYMNALCSFVFYSDVNLPTTSAKVKTLWDNYLESEKIEISKELSQLSDVQRKLIVNISLGNNKELSSKENLIKLDASSSSIIKSLKILIDKDYIMKNTNHEYSLIDPAIKHAICLSYLD